MADAFSAIAVRTDTDAAVVVGIASGQTVGVSGTVNVSVQNASLNVAVTSALPTGTNSIGNIGTVGSITSPLPAGANVIGGISGISNPLPTGTNTIGSIASITNALPTGSNTIGNVGVTGTVNVSVTSPIPAGTNVIGKVQVVDTTGTTRHETVATSGNVIKNGGTSTVNSSAITNGKTAELRQIIVASSVAMKCVIRVDNTITPVNEAVTYLPAGGGQQLIPFADNAVLLAGTVAGENFDVVFTNLDTKNDAEAHVTFTWIEEP